MRYIAICRMFPVIPRRIVEGPKGCRFLGFLLHLQRELGRQVPQMLVYGAFDVNQRRLKASQYTRSDMSFGV